MNERMTAKLDAALTRLLAATPGERPAMLEQFVTGLAPAEAAHLRSLLEFSMRLKGAPLPRPRTAAVVEGRRRMLRTVAAQADAKQPGMFWARVRPLGALAYASATLGFVLLLVIVWQIGQATLLKSPTPTAEIPTQVIEVIDTATPEATMFVGVTETITPQVERQIDLPTPFLMPTMTSMPSNTPQPTATDTLPTPTQTPLPTLTPAPSRTATATQAPPTVTKTPQTTPTATASFAPTATQPPPTQPPPASQPNNPAPANTPLPPAPTWTLAPPPTQAVFTPTSVPPTMAPTPMPSAASTSAVPPTQTRPSSNSTPTRAARTPPPTGRPPSPTPLGGHRPEHTPGVTPLLHALPTPTPVQGGSLLRVLLYN